MNSVPNIESLLASALISGEVSKPQRLLDAVTLISSPLAFLCSLEPEAEPFNILSEDYPWLRSLRFSEKAINEEETTEAVTLLRWVLKELSGWSKDLDPRLVNLTVVVMTLNAFGWNDQHWSLLSNQSVNPELLNLFCDTIKNYHCEISVEPMRYASKVDALTTLLATADSQGDWAKIASSWQHIETWLRSGILLTIAAPCLARFNMTILASAMSEISQIQTAYLVAKSLSEINLLKLARSTSSWRYRFASVLSINWSQHAHTGFDEEIREQLSRLLTEVSQDTDQWARWMVAFNLNPARFPAFQLSLGEALANAPEHALASYVNSIALSAWPLDQLHKAKSSRPNGRECVALCLMSFREKASKEQKERLWHLAYTRWQSWNFGIQHLESYPFSIAGCELDFAITAYSVECLSTDQRNKLLAFQKEELANTEMAWHSTLSKLLTHRNASLSKMQPLLAAGDDDWLFTQPSLPPGLVQSAYTKRKFKI